MNEMIIKYDQEWEANNIAIQEEADVITRREKSDQMIRKMADYVDQEMKSPHDLDKTLDLGIDGPSNFGVSTIALDVVAQPTQNYFD